MIKATVYDKKLSVENVTVSDGVKFDTVTFVFPEKWKNYQKTAVFKTDDGVKVNVLLDAANPLCLSEEECYIPYEVLVSPCFYLSVFGINGDSVATTTLEKVKVLKSGYIKGDMPSNPSMTEYEQIVSLAAAAKNLAQSVREDADNGLFKGEKGDTGNVNVDLDYNAKSQNAQSGIAVAQALETKADLTLLNEIKRQIGNFPSDGQTNINDSLVYLMSEIDEIKTLILSNS